ncbi:MAG: hypothetical protein ACLFN8_04925 [Candidatus Woesearchaeota archaeon]
MVFKKRENLLFIGFVFLFLFVVSSSFASAEYKTVKDAWFEHDEVFVVDGDIYQVFIHPSFVGSDSPGRVIVRINDESVVASLDSCNDDDLYRVCYKNFSFDKKMSVYNNNLVPGIEVKISKDDSIVVEPEADLSVKSSISGNRFINEVNEGVLTLENVGDINIHNAILVVKLPQNVSISDRRGFDQTSFNQLRRSFSLNKEGVVDFDFDFRLLSLGSFKFDYEVILDGDVIESGSFSVGGVVPYSVSVSAPDKSDIREIHTFEVVVENKHSSEDLILSDLLISAPVEFQYLSRQRLSSRGIGLFGASNVVLEPGDKMVYSFRFRPLFAKDYEFNVLAEFDFLGLLKFSESAELGVINEGFSAGLLFSRKQISLGADNNLVLTLENNHESLTFRDIDVVVVSELFNYSDVVPSISAGTTNKLIDQKVSVPQLKENKEYFANATIIFTNEGGQRETIELSDSFVVLGNDSIVAITQKVSSKSAQAGDELIVEVSLRNLVDNHLGGVLVEDSFSQNVEFITGKQSVESTFSAKESKGVYIYKIKIPERPYSDELIITTAVVIPNLNYELSASTEVSITGDIYEDSAPPIVDDVLDEDEDGSSVVSDNLNESEDVESGSDNESGSEADDLADGVLADEDDEVRENFLRRMISGVERFFSRLFGGK